MVLDGWVGFVLNRVSPANAVVVRKITAKQSANQWLAIRCMAKSYIFVLVGSNARGGIDSRLDMLTPGFDRQPLRPRLAVVQVD